MSEATSGMSCLGAHAATASVGRGDQLVMPKRDDFAWIIDFSVVIARESGRSSNHKILRDYWMPRFRGA